MDRGLLVRATTFECSRNRRQPFALIQHGSHYLAKIAISQSLEMLSKEPGSE
jgi:hypothetical protein